MEKRKVLFITPSLCQGGLEHYLILMLQMMDKNRYDITLFVYGDDMSLQNLVPSEVNIVKKQGKSHYFRKPKAIFYQLMIMIGKFLCLKTVRTCCEKKLREYIHSEKMKQPAKTVFKDKKFDIVIANAVGAPMEMALHLLTEKKYVFFHSSLDLHHELMERLFPKFDGIVAVSMGVKEMLHQQYPQVNDKILLLENYIDAEHIIKKAGESSKEYECKYESNEIKICTCGRLSKEKGFDLAVEAASILNKKGYSFKWLFIGDGQEKESIEQMIHSNSLAERVFITGYMDNPFVLIKNCDIYVQPSYEESYGRSIKEAQILGRPIVSTATVGGKILIKDGETGVLTKINAEALANGIQEMMDNEVLRQKYASSYSNTQNIKERQIFEEGLEKLLSRE